MKKKFLKQLVKYGKWILILFVAYKILIFLGRRLDMKNTIEEKSDLKISFFFQVVSYSYFHMPQAFDSDYTWTYVLKLNEDDFESVKNQVLKSKFYNSYSQYDNTVYDSLSIYDLKGFWISIDGGYKFVEGKEAVSEITDIKIDSTKRTIEVNLDHL